MSEQSAEIQRPVLLRALLRLGDLLKIPALAVLTAFLIGGVIIWITSGSLETVIEAYSGLVRGAFFKQRGFSESLVATIPYVLLSLGVAVGFKTGLFNIGVEGQFFMGALGAAWIGQVSRDIPGIIHLPLALLAGAVAGGLWAAIPGFLKARTGAHEVITTIMMNYIAFRFVEYMISGPIKDPNATATQTAHVSTEAELWTFAAIPQRLQDPLNAFGVALIAAVITALIVRWLIGMKRLQSRFPGKRQQRIIYLLAGLAAGLLTFFVLPPLTQAWWPFTDPYDRLHIGLFLAFGAAIFIWWLLWRTTLGFEMRTVGENPNAARYAGINITRNIILAMVISGALAGVAGTIEVLGVSTCRCLPLFFSSGYGFDSIAIALLAKNDPFGILAASFLFGAMRNGADLMELVSGVSKYIISLIQALALLFVAAPTIVRWIYRVRAERGVAEGETTISQTWGGG